MVQCFIPVGTTFEECARTLDRVRLGNQRIEANAILTSIRLGNGWCHHPTARMWADYEGALEQYIRACIIEWMRRGYRNNLEIPRRNVRAKIPEWWGYEPIHLSHRRSLMYKYPEWYSQFNWRCKAEFNYVYWPG